MNHKKISPDICNLSRAGARHSNVPPPVNESLWCQLKPCCALHKSLHCLSIARCSVVVSTHTQHLAGRGNQEVDASTAAMTSSHFSLFEENSIPTVAPLILYLGHCQVSYL